jgi:hypothetical protein
MGLRDHGEGQGDFHRDKLFDKAPLRREDILHVTKAYTISFLKQS